ncbi:hypothetical protein FRC00_012114, partial [Tulasnella sp. 408]
MEAAENSRGSGQRDGELARRNMQVARHRNSLVPINRVPTELLMAIFDASLEAYSDRFESLEKIASVAWMWSSIVKQAPVLWAVLESSTCMERLLIFLKRAGDFSLKIEMHLDPSDRNLHLYREHPPPDTAAFLRWSCPNSLVGKRPKSSCS